MKQKIKWIFIITLLLSTATQAQLTKGNWLVGGTANFSSANGETISSAGTQKSTYINISASPTVGYFIADQFAIGLKPSLSWFKANYGQSIREGLPTAGGGYANETWFDVGPFIRYYFLPTDNQVNLFAEANYSHGIQWNHPGKGKRDSYSFFAGPAIYLNSSVAIEFAVGYNSTKSVTYGLNSSNDDYRSKRNSFQLSIGFQIHLEKE